MTLPLFGGQPATGALFSECRAYRYRLWRHFGDGPRLLFVMLNPSTADDVANDPTVERCQRRAARMGYGSLEVVNLFAFRATDPKLMRAAGDPVGPENDVHILHAAADAAMIIAAWGAHGSFRGRGGAVRTLLAGRVLHCLTLTAAGDPGHPLYVGYDVQPQPLP